MEEALDFRFIYPKVQHLYSRHGRPSIDPVVLFKMLIINIVFGINSMRKTCQEIEVNLAYRWFLGLSIDEKIPNFSTWSQNYIRRYKDSTIFQEIFMEILEQAVDYGFVDFTTVFGDSTHQKANANKRKSVKKEVEILKKKYEDDLLVEINEDRECIGKESFDSMVHTEYVHDEETGEEVKKTSTKTITESTIDPESGCFHKGEKEKCFAYSHQTFCDKNSFVLAVTTVPGNVHDSVSFFDAYEELINGKYEMCIRDSFYCDPMQSGQKGSLENMHRELRYILPNEVDLRSIGLTDQTSLNVAISHINSSAKEHLNGKSPFELCEFMCPELAQKLYEFGLQKIDKDEVILRPSVLTHK